MIYKILLFYLLFFVKVNAFSQNIQLYILTPNDKLAIKNGDSISISIFKEKKVRIMAIDSTQKFNYKINRGSLWLYSLERNQELIVASQYDLYFSELDKSKILNKSIHKIFLAFTIQKLLKSKFMEGIPCKLELFIKM